MIQTNLKYKRGRIVIPNYDICNSVVQKMIAQVGNDLLHVSDSWPVQNNYGGIQFVIQAIWQSFLILVMIIYDGKNGDDKDDQTKLEHAEHGKWWK